MAIKLLIVDKDLDAGSAVLGSLGQGEVEVVFIPHGERAINAVRKNDYSVIILGDKLVDHSDTYDVGMAIKGSTHNKHTPVICVGSNRPRQTKLVGLLSPYSYSLDVGDKAAIDTCTGKIRDHLTSLSSPPKKSK